MRHPWTDDEARIWWTKHRRQEPIAAVAAEATIVDESRVQGLTVQVDVQGRTAIEDAAKPQEDALVQGASPKKG